MPIDKKIWDKLNEKPELYDTFNRLNSILDKAGISDDDIPNDVLLGFVEQYVKEQEGKKEKVDIEIKLMAQWFRQMSPSEHTIFFNEIGKPQSKILPIHMQMEHAAYHPSLDRNGRFAMSMIGNSIELKKEEEQINDLT